MLLITTLLLLAQDPSPANPRSGVEAPDPHVAEVLSQLGYVQEPAEIPRHIQIYEVASLLQDPWSALGEEEEAEEENPMAGLTGQRDFWEVEVAKSETWSGYGDAAHPYGSAAELLRTLNAFMWPPIDARFETLQLDKGYLVAHLRKEQHKWVADFLHRLRGGHTWQGRVDARFIRLPKVAPASWAWSEARRH